MNKRNIYTLIGATAAVVAGVVTNSALSIIPAPFEVVDDPSTNNNIVLVGNYPTYTVTASVNGTPDDWIIIDASQAAIRCLRIYGSYISVRGYGTGTVTGCNDHAVFINKDKTKVNGVYKYPASGTFVEVTGMIVRNNDKRDTGGSSGSWPSALKCEQGSSYIQFHHNVVFENFGEGVGCTMSSYAWIYENEFRDNWSVAGGYLDNGDHYYFFSNRVVNTGIAKFSRFSANERWNGCAAGGLENYSSYGWTTNHLSDVVIAWNDFRSCKRVGYWNPMGIAAQNVTITGNTFYDVPAPVVVFPGANISGNVVLTVTPAPATATKTQTTATFTPTRTPTVTPTGIPPSATPVAVCEEIYRIPGVVVIQACRE